MNLSKILVTVTFLVFILTGFSQTESIPSYSSASCNGKVFVTNSYSNWGWFEADSTTSIGVNVDTVSNLCPGTYVLHYQSGGNWYYTTETVYDKDSCRNFNNNFWKQQPTHPDSCNGILEIGEPFHLRVPPYTFNWSTGDTTRQVDSVCTGVYNVVITDGYGCVDSIMDSTYAYNGGDILPPWVNYINNPTGFHTCDGEVEFAVYGLTPPINAVVTVSDNSLHQYNTDNDTVFTVTSNSTTVTIGNVCAGDLFIRFYGSQGWESFRGVTMYDTLLYLGCNNFELYVNTTNVTTSSSCDGTATVFASGNDGMVSYYWLDVQQDTIDTSNFLDSVCAATYVVHAYDQNNCYLNYVCTVGDSNGIEIGYNVLNEASSLQSCDGEYLFQITGGTPPYITWNSATLDSNNWSPDNLCPGIHRLDVWDATNSYQGLNYLVVPTSQLYNGIQGATPIDTLNGEPEERCDIDYDDIVNAYIINYTIVDSTITTNWIINYGSGGNDIVTIEYIANIDTSEVYAFSLSIFCSQLKAFDKRFKAYSDLSGTPLGLTTNEKIEFNIYPNPSSGDFNIQSNLEGDYKVHSLTGKIIKTGTIQEGDNQIKLNHKGVFLIHFETDKGGLVRRVISQ